MGRMRMKPNPRYDEMQDAIHSAMSELCGSWAGDCWRYQSITHPSGREILSGAGALSNGGRWNAPGAFPVVYGSTTASVALAESEANDRYFGLVCRKARLHVCIGMSFSRVLDLTSASVLRKLGLKARELQAEDWRKINNEMHESLTQCLGRAAGAAGVEALLTPSACVKGGVNIAYFPGNKARGSKVTLHDEGEIKAMLSGRRR